MYEQQIADLFKNISSKIAKPTQGFFETHIDQTITIENLINFLNKQDLIFNVRKPWVESDQTLKPVEEP